MNARRALFVMTVGTGAAGLTDELSLTPFLRGVGSWSALDTRLRALAPQVGFAAAELGAKGRIRLLHSLHPAQARPLGSAFKLYVLGALGRAVAEHRARWSERLRIRQAWKSLPSGVLQNEPAGTALPLRTFADLMISISDNTAADHLIHRVGRSAVEAQLRRLGNEHAQRTIPVPTTRELFALKGRDFPAAATRYLALSPRGRRTALGRLDRFPLTSLRPWTAPRDIDSIEWFGSPSDIIRAYAGLAAENARPGLSTIGSALSINDSGLGLDRRSYPTVWFKGGSEPGVLTLTYLVRTRTGHTLVEALMLADHRRPIAPAATPELLALARSAISLSTHGG